MADKSTDVTNFSAPLKSLIDSIAQSLGADPSGTYCYSKRCLETNRDKFYYYALFPITIDRFYGEDDTIVHSRNRRHHYNCYVYMPHGKYISTPIPVNEKILTDCRYDPADTDFLRYQISENILRLIQTKGLKEEQEAKQRKAIREEVNSFIRLGFKPLQPMIDEIAKTYNADTTQRSFYHYALNPRHMRYVPDDHPILCKESTAQSWSDKKTLGYVYYPAGILVRDAMFEGLVTREIIKDCYYDPVHKDQISKDINRNIVW